jgi:hypothetical protein
MQHVLQAPDLLQQGLQPLNALLTCFSLAIFPFVLPPFMKQAIGLELTPEFLQQLAVHQRHVLHHGLLQPLAAEPQPTVPTLPDTGVNHD